VNNRTVFHSGGSKPDCAAPLFNQRDSARSTPPRGALRVTCMSISTTRRRRDGDGYMTIAASVERQTL
jgi:hypothetical protein